MSMHNASAQSFEGQPVRLGATRLIPEVRLEYENVDNAFRSNDNEVDADGFIVAPAVSFEADRRLLELNATYRGRFGTFSESALDFVDHDLRASVEAKPATRHNVSANFRYLQEAEDFGTGQAIFETNADDQIIDRTASLNFGYAYGAAAAQGNIGGGLTLVDRTFSGLDDITDGDDSTSIGPFVYFSYRVSPDTRLRLEARFLDRDFDADNRDRSEIGLFAGADLAATDRTGGSVRLGVTESDFDLAGVNNRTTFVADVNVYFQPTSRTRLDLLFGRDFQTVDQAVDGVGESVVDDFRLSWRQNWTARFSTRVNFDVDNIDRECPGTVDTLTSGGSIDFDVNIRRWLSVGAGYGFTRRTADVCDAGQDNDSFEFDLNSYTVHVTATL